MASDPHDGPWHPALHQVLCEGGAMAVWYFTASDGHVKRKNSDKLTPSTVRETFERAALGVGNRGGLSAVRRNEAGAQILSHDAVRDLMRDPVDLAGIDALQLYIQGKGGNATRYVCDYRYDRVTYRGASRAVSYTHLTLPTICSV
eukprot:5952924-Prymnesium_polylepis.2